MNKEKGKPGGSQGKRRKRRQEGPVNPIFKSLIWNVGMAHTLIFCLRTFGGGCGRRGSFGEGRPELSPAAKKESWIWAQECLQLPRNDCGAAYPGLGELPFSFVGILIWVHKRTAEKLEIRDNSGFRMVRWLLYVRVNLVSAHFGGRN